MRKLVLFGEGNFGPALLESALIVGQHEADENTFALDGSNMIEFRRNFDSICNTVYNRDSLLLLCDISTSGIAREAWLVLEKRGLMNKALFVTGASVPTALAALVFKDLIDTDEELIKTLKAQSEQGLMFFEG
ncbi:hypothetical protein IM774_04330 [Erysipelotrichaceae bacterium RD49]|nr:hypothetical protein [Erysipelotrichaceae bacterium RD49]